MTALSELKTTVCPHDCPSACALRVEVIDGARIGKVYGHDQNTYTKGVICAKVGRYSERVHSEGRLTKPLKRTGVKGSGEFAPISWDDALDEVANNLLRIEKTYGAQAMWPYIYGGNMGEVAGASLDFLTDARGYSQSLRDLCVSISYSGWRAAVGEVRGTDAREIAHSDVVVIWGSNVAHTQVNVITHAVKARKRRGAKIVVVDIYDNDTTRQADLSLILRPGTDAALALALIHILFRDGGADRAYMKEFSDDPEGLEAHVRHKTPFWAAGITGLSEDTIEKFGSLLCQHPKTFFRLGLGFSRQHNGAVSLHSVACIPTVMGAWRHLGGGALHASSGGFDLDLNAVTYHEKGLKPASRILSMARIGAVLTGNEQDLHGLGPVYGMIVMSSNPAVVAPNLNKVHAGLARSDLFLCVHEQFMTETARFADIVLPATTFVEADDLVKTYGHSHIQLSPKLIDPIGESKSNLEVVQAIAKRLGVEHTFLRKTALELVQQLLNDSDYPDLTRSSGPTWYDIDEERSERTFSRGFDTADGKFHFKPNWSQFAEQYPGGLPVLKHMPQWPDHWQPLPNDDLEHPFTLATSPARSFLNSTFSNIKGSIDKEEQPYLLINPEDANEHHIEEYDPVVVGNDFGKVELTARFRNGLQRGVIVAEGLWAGTNMPLGKGINVLVSDEPVGPIGGFAAHGTHVWLRGLVDRRFSRAKRDPDKTVGKKMAAG